MLGFLRMQWRSWSQSEGQTVHAKDSLTETCVTFSARAYNTCGSCKVGTKIGTRAFVVIRLNLDVTGPTVLVLCGLPRRNPPYGM